MSPIDSIVIVVLALVLALSLVTEAVVPLCQNTSDCTKELQDALHVGGAITLTAAGSPWITEPLVASENNTLLQFEHGAVLLAKRWAFKKPSPSSSLVRIPCGKENITIRGGTMRMWRQDYSNPNLYNHSEDRMILDLCNTVDVTIEDMILEESGGDGIYVGGGGVNRNLALRNVVSRNNYRQGISVISVDGLYVVNSTFEGTKGTPPESGVDFEPNIATQRLTNILFENCTFRNNSGYGIDFALHAFDATTVPISITMRDIIIEDNPNLSGIIVGAALHLKGGYINVSRVLIQNMHMGGISACGNSPRGPLVTIDDVMMSNTSVGKPKGYPPVKLHSSTANLKITRTTIDMSADTDPEMPAVDILCESKELCPDFVDIEATVLTPFPLTGAACKICPMFHASRHHSVVNLRCVNSTTPGN